MKLSDMKTNEELIAEELQNDPAFRAEWERTAVARAVAVAVVRYRAEHELSQRDLAARLAMEQPQVARLERGDVNPSIETLMRVSSRLGIEFIIDVRPAESEPRLLSEEARNANAVGTVRARGAEVLVAAA
jgi:ribosome-binding protein aMBF1 (putative translation factor)